MKSSESQTYYQILEVRHEATWGEIERAYELAKKTYGKDAIASYSLFDPAERRRILEKVEEAYRVLSRSEKRQKYDQDLKEAASPKATPVSIFALPPTSQAKATTQRAVTPTPPPSVEPVTVPAVLVEEPIPDAVTGATIKSFREKRGLSLEAVAAFTRINIDYLCALEADRFEFLPAEVYVRSYLKQYVKMLQYGENVVESYMTGYRNWSLVPKVNKSNIRF